MIEILETDVLVLGAGGAGLCAALHAADASPRLAVTVVVKGLLGRAGCTRMVQGGYNAVLTPPDVISQVMMAGPIIVLYMGSVLVSLLVARRRRKQD